MTETPIFNVAQLLKEPVGATRHGEIDALLADLVPDLTMGLEPQPDAQLAITGPVRLMHTTQGVLVEGDLHADAVVPCSRCLEPVKVELDVPVEETFEPTLDIVSGQLIKPEEEDEALWIDEHHILDMSEVLRQDILLALPPHVLCRADCRGLCPTCGQNLNEGTCDCQAEVDPRWEALQSLLSDKENNHSDKE